MRPNRLYYQCLWCLTSANGVDTSSSPGEGWRAYRLYCPHADWHASGVNHKHVSQRPKFRASSNVRPEAIVSKQRHRIWASHRYYEEKLPSPPKNYDQVPARSNSPCTICSAICICTTVYISIMRNKGHWGLYRISKKNYYFINVYTTVHIWYTLKKTDFIFCKFLWTIFNITQFYHLITINIKNPKYS